MFCADIIGPLVKRVMRALGIRDETSWKKLFDYGSMEIPFEVENGIGSSESKDIQSGMDVGFLAKVSAGTIFKVVLDGTEYTCSANVDIDYVSIGDTSGEWTTEFPFYVDFLRNEDGSWDMVIGVNNDKPTHTVALYMQTETIHPISDKYLPGVCLPVVDIKSVTVADVDMELTDEESAQLTKAASAKLPIVIRIYIEESVRSMALEYYEDDSGVMYVGASYHGSGIEVYKDADNAWKITFL